MGEVRRATRLGIQWLLALPAVSERTLRHHEREPASRRSRCRLARAAMVVLAAGILAVLFVACSSGGKSGGKSRHTFVKQWIVSRSAFASSHCQVGAAVPEVAYALEPSVRGLAPESPSYFCLPAPGPLAVSGPRGPVGYVSVLYGTCDSSGGPCRPPLEIQSWAECARNKNSYSPYPGTPLAPGEKPGEVFGDSIVLPGASQLPVLSFEEGARLELFAGSTAVVVYAQDRSLARDAADTLASEIVAHLSGNALAQLRSDANQPGDASACHHLLTTGLPKGTPHDQDVRLARDLRALQARPR
jgi:hypothetical protein